MLLPRALEKVKAPPIKCQGIKTKLVRYIGRSIKWEGSGRWIEPFLGSGSVLFNIDPPQALAADSNSHIIQFYRDIQNGKVDEINAREYLEENGEKLRKYGQEYYYHIRDDFNSKGGSLKFLFLNRSSFNGIIRFNAGGYYNVPFGHKPHRFKPPYITKIVNQIKWVKGRIVNRDWIFKAQGYGETLSECTGHDFVYLDPPYIGRHADYLHKWDEDQARRLTLLTEQLKCGFALSLWLKNRYRENKHLSEYWANNEIRTFSHFYHVGAQERLRNAVIEALIIKPGFASPAGSSTLDQH